MADRFTVPLIPLCVLLAGTASCASSPDAQQGAAPVPAANPCPVEVGVGWGIRIGNVSLHLGSRQCASSPEGDGVAVPAAPASEPDASGAEAPPTE